MKITEGKIATGIILLIAITFICIALAVYAITKPLSPFVEIAASLLIGVGITLLLMAKVHSSYTRT